MGVRSNVTMCPFISKGNNALSIELWCLICASILNDLEFKMLLGETCNGHCGLKLPDFEVLYCL
jgi:hypothetical protein